MIGDLEEEGMHLDKVPKMSQEEEEERNVLWKDDIDGR